MKIEKNLLQLLRCPICKQALKKKKAKLVCTRKHEFEIDQIPIMLTDTAGWKEHEIEEQTEMSEKYKYLRESYLFSLFVNGRWNRKILSGITGNPKTALDAGCGSGMLMQSVQKRFPKTNVYGFDLTPAMVAIANQKNHGKVVSADIEHIPFKNSTFDLVTCRGVLHHLGDEAQALNEIKRILTKQGTFIVSEPNNASWLLRLMRSKIRKHKGFKPNELKNKLERAGLEVQKTEYFGLLSFPFGMPDLFPLFRKSKQYWLIRFLSWIDKKIENNNFLQKLCFHVIYTCKAV